METCERIKILLYFYFLIMCEIFGDEWILVSKRIYGAVETNARATLLVSNRGKAEAFFSYSLLV